MAIPVLVKAAAKKIIVDIFTDSEKFFKYVFYIIVAILVIVGLFVVPIYLLLNFPSVLFDSAYMSEEDKNIQLEIVDMYKNAPDVANSINLDWIKDKKKEYSGYDDIVVSYDFELDFYQLMAIDAVRYDQDFSSVTLDGIQNLTEYYFTKDVHTSTYEVDVTKTRNKKDKDGNDILDELGNVVKETYTTTEKRDRAHIKIDVKDFNKVLYALNFDDKQINAALNMYTSIQYIENGGSIFSDEMLNN